MFNDNKLHLTDIFFCVPAVRMIEYLCIKPEVTIKEIKEAIGTNYNTVVNCFEHFIKCGLVEKKKFGRIAIFRFKTEYYPVKALINLVDFFKEYIKEDCVNWRNEFVNANHPMLEDLVGDRNE